MQTTKTKKNVCTTNVYSTTSTAHSHPLCTHCGMAPECSRYHQRLADKIAQKTDQRYEEVVAWIRCKLSFLMMKSALLCLRGSRSCTKYDACDEARLNSRWIRSIVKIWMWFVEWNWQMNVKSVEWDIGVSILGFSEAKMKFLGFSELNMRNLGSF